jgi:hypothetical protein
VSQSQPRSLYQGNQILYYDGEGDRDAAHFALLEHQSLVSASVLRFVPVTSPKSSTRFPALSA